MRAGRHPCPPIAPRLITHEGPVRADDHYRLPPLRRWDLDGVGTLVDRKKCFVLTGLGSTGGWLVIFDRRCDQPPMAERAVRREAPSPQGRLIAVIRA